MSAHPLLVGERGVMDRNRATLEVIGDRGRVSEEGHHAAAVLLAAGERLREGVDDNERRRDAHGFDRSDERVPVVPFRAEVRRRFDQIEGHAMRQAVSVSQFKARLAFARPASVFGGDVDDWTLLGPAASPLPAESYMEAEVRDDEALEGL